MEARLAEGVDYLKIAVDDGAVSGMNLPVRTTELAAAWWRPGTPPTQGHRPRGDRQGGTDRAGRRRGRAGPLYSDVPEEEAEATAARIASYDAFVISTIVYIEAVTGGNRRRRAAARPAGRARCRSGRRPRFQREITPSPCTRPVWSTPPAPAVALLRAGVPVLAGHGR
ncbi:hypothetical protein GCM10020220_075130 [Nonomuraea rubra]|uniref:hypothetical protein n=1 Tax=Nonomuraea rubra TaxID=46180 RepID=UPI0031EEEDBB